MLVGVASAATEMRIGVLPGLVTSLGVIVLAALLYVVLREHGRTVALVAFGWWLGEAIVLAVAKAGDAALIALGQAFVAAGSPTDAHFRTLATFLYEGLDKGLGSTTHMFFYCAGGLLWYALFYRSRAVPRAIGAFGLAAVALASVGIVVQILGADVPIVVYLPLLPFELLIGTWLLVRGVAPRSRS